MTLENSINKIRELLKQDSCSFYIRAHLTHKLKNFNSYYTEIGNYDKTNDSFKFFLNIPCDRLILTDTTIETLKNEIVPILDRHMENTEPLTELNNILNTWDVKEIELKKFNTTSSEIIEHEIRVRGYEDSSSYTLKTISITSN